MIIKRIFFNKKSIISSILFFFKEIIYFTFYMRLKQKSPLIFYPFEKYRTSNRYRGLIALTTTEKSELSCISCGICLSVCPVNCLYIETNNVLKNEQRPPLDFKIDILKCVYCGFCEEICPVDAIRLTSELPPIIRKKKMPSGELRNLLFAKV